MGLPKTREERRNLVLPARLRDDAGWRDVTICNVSSRGLMAKCAAPPPKGAFVEVRHRSTCIVGQVRWAQGMRFGLRTQDRIDVIGLIAGKAAAAPGGNDRRAVERPPQRTPEMAAERSRVVARAINWSIAAVTIAAAVGLVASMASTALRKPLERVEHALGASHH